MSKITVAERDFVGVGDIAGYCMVSRSAVTRWIKTGKLQAIKLPSGRFRVSVADFRTFLKQQSMPITQQLLDPWDNPSTIRARPSHSRAW